MCSGKLSRQLIGYIEISNNQVKHLLLLPCFNYRFRQQQPLIYELQVDCFEVFSNQGVMLAHKAKVQEEDAIHPPNNVCLRGEYCNVLSFNPDLHAESLAANILHDYVWEYISTDLKVFKRPTTAHELSDLIKTLGFSFFVIQKKGEDTCYGTFAMMCEPQSHSVELGYVLYNKEIQKTAVTTQAFYLITNYAFEVANYNRYFWKCHSLNLPSMSAAYRFGYRYQGTRRAHMVQRSAYRHTAYFSTLKKEWNLFKQQFQRWLQRDNFDQEGQQITKLQCRQIRQKLDQQE